MTNSPLITINVPTYNHENYLGACLDSILNQTYKNIEIILVEDCSKDKTREVAELYQKKYPDKIKLISNKKNLGLGETWMKGYRAATGDFFLPFSGDDIMQPETIETHLKALQENPAASMSVVNGHWFESETNTILKLHYMTPPKEITLKWLVKKGQRIFAPATMQRASMLPEDESFHGEPFSEWAFFASVLKNGDGVYTHKPLIRYRRHSDNLSSQGFAREYQENMTAIKYFRRHIKDLPEINLGHAKQHKNYARFWLKQKKNVFFWAYHKTVEILLYVRYVLKKSIKRFVRSKN